MTDVNKKGYIFTLFLQILTYKKTPRYTISIGGMVKENWKYKILVTVVTVVNQVLNNF